MKMAVHVLMIVDMSITFFVFVAAIMSLFLLFFTSHFDFVTIWSNTVPELLKNISVRSGICTLTYRCRGCGIP